MNFSKKHKIQTPTNERKKKRTRQNSWPQNYAVVFSIPDKKNRSKRGRTLESSAEISSANRRGIPRKWFELSLRIIDFNCSLIISRALVHSIVQNLEIQRVRVRVEAAVQRLLALCVWVWSVDDDDDDCGGDDWFDEAPEHILDILKFWSRARSRVLFRSKKPRSQVTWARIRYRAAVIYGF